MTTHHPGVHCHVDFRTTVVALSFAPASPAGDAASLVISGAAGERRSTLRGTVGGGGADLVVGVNGAAAMLVEAGGLADLRDDFILGQHAGSSGRATVRGVRDGFRSTVDVTGNAGASIQIGGGDSGGAAFGSLTIQDGGLVPTSSHVLMARFVGAEAEMVVGGASAGIPAELAALGRACNWAILPVPRPEFEPD